MFLQRDRSMIPWGGLGCCFSATALYLLGRTSGRDAGALKSVTTINQLKDLAVLLDTASKVLPLVVTISGRVGSESPIKCEHSCLRGVIVEETAEQHFLKHSDAGSWIQDSAIMLSLSKEVPWYLDDGTGRAFVVGARGATGLVLPVVSEAFEDSGRSIVRGTLDYLQGLKMLGVKRIERVLPTGTSLTVVGEAVKDDMKEIRMQHSYQWSIYTSPGNIDQLIGYLGKWTRLNQYASTGLTIIGVYLLAKHFIQYLQLIQIFSNGLTNDYTNWILTCCCQGTDIGLAIIYDMLRNKRRHFLFSTMFFNSLIPKVCRSYRVIDAMKLFRIMPQLGCIPDSSIWDTLLCGVCSNDSIRLALQVIPRGGCRKPDIVACHVVLENFLKSGVLELSFRLFKEIIINREMVPHIYSVLVKYCCRVGRLDLGLDLFFNMLEHGCSPKRGMMNALIHGLVSQKRIDDAKYLFDKMFDMSCLPNVFTCNTIMKGFFSEGNTVVAMELYREMLKPGRFCRPNLITYNIVIDNLLKEGAISDALHLLGEIVNNGHPPNVVTFNVFMDFLCKREWVEDAQDLFNFITKIGKEPTVISYNILMHGYCKKGEIDMSVKLFQLMKTNRVKPNLCSYNIMIDGFLKNHQVDDARRIFHDMMDLDISPNVVTYSILINACSKRKLFREAHAYWDLMLQNGEFPTLVTYSCLVNGYCSVGLVDEALQIFRQMISEGHQPDTFAYSALIKGYIISGRFLEAIQLFKRMMIKGPKPNVVAYTALMLGFLKAGRTSDALQTYNKMKENNIRPTKITYQIMLDGLIRKGWLEKANEIFFSFEDHLCHLNFERVAITNSLNKLVYRGNDGELHGNPSSTSTEKDSAVRDGEGAIRIQRPFKGPFYVSPKNIDQLIAYLGKWTRWYQYAYVGFTFFGVYLLAKHAIQYIQQRRRHWELHKRVLAAAAQRQGQDNEGANSVRVSDSTRKEHVIPALCVICLEEEYNAVFVPCGHMCCCMSCSSHLSNCPLCRGRIEQIVRAYRH